ncbi:MAG: hypothetical protein WBF93_00350, partial [Pirellulales bacterium]
VQLPAGKHQLTGDFRWQEMPQRIVVPKQIGVVSLVVDGTAVPIPKWDAEGNVWFKRTRAEAGKDLLAAKVYRVVEDGIPVWLHTDIELSVSGKSREEQLGWSLPEGWKLSKVESPIPVAVNDLGIIKAQVRAGKWTIGVHAFRREDIKQFKYASSAAPLATTELVGYRAKPEFRIAEIEGIPVVDVTQTTFPTKWRDLPVYQWKTDSPFRLVERMRGMGGRRTEGLNIDRHFWLDEDGKGLTYRDTLTGSMQQIWRLDVADQQQLGAVRIDGNAQLITTNPLKQTADHGVEIRNRNLNMEAIGRIDRTGKLSATGWQANADSLQLTLTLPPGWRVFALFGADRVEGDWLTAWSLLDLFLLLLFALAVFRLWGITAGIIALLAFGMAYHEPGAPRLTWFFLLIPLALLRVLPDGIGKRLVTGWKYLAVAVLLLQLVPFIASQIQSAIYPQLEYQGTMYGSRPLLGPLSDVYEDYEKAGEFEGGRGIITSTAGIDIQNGNVTFASTAKIQTGPAEPKWSWNQVDCVWNGPVAKEQRITPILIPQSLHRLLNTVTVMLLLVLAAILIGVGKYRKKLPKHSIAAVAALGIFLAPEQLLAQFPDKQMLDTLRQRLLEPSDAFPHAAEIPSVDLNLNQNKIVMTAEVHAALRVAVPLPGRLPAWSPLSVTIDGAGDAAVCRLDGFVWVIVPKGVHNVVVEGLLPEATEWEWSFRLKPRRVSIDAPGWNVTGVRRNGVPEEQVFFSRQKRSSDGEAAYDQKNFHAIATVDRHLEVGLIWKVRNVVSRLSSTGKAVSLKVPLLAGERVVTSNVVVENGLIEVRLGAGQSSFQWESELPKSEEIRLEAKKEGEWVERWYLVTSPVWNVAPTGIEPVFESDQANLIPVWQPWPGESVSLAISQPEAIKGDTITVQQVMHEISLGSRQRTTELKLDLECSLGEEFVMELDADADITSLTLDGGTIPVRRDGTKLFVQLSPGKRSVEAAWRTSAPMKTHVTAGGVKLPFDASNVTTVMRVPENRWVLWANGPLRGPAVRFWTILVVAILAAVALGSVPSSPLHRIEWLLLTLGLTQVHVAAAMFVVGWLFLLAWRGKEERHQAHFLPFNLMQVGIVLFTLVALGILVAAVAAGLLGDPKMFILGNGSSQTYLKWFQPRVGTELPDPYVVSVSVWFYRLLMLCWALWLAAALLRWLKWGWSQFSNGECWKPFRRKVIATSATAPG